MTTEPVTDARRRPPGVTSAAALLVAGLLVAACAATSPVVDGATRPTGSEATSPGPSVGVSLTAEPTPVPDECTALEGRVTDEAGEPIVDAMLVPSPVLVDGYCEPIEPLFLTDEGGFYYIFGVLPPGVWEVEAHAQGFVPSTRHILVEPHGRTRADFVLMRAAP